jgi:hypothetical protein
MPFNHPNVRSTKCRPGTIWPQKNKRRLDLAALMNAHLRTEHGVHTVEDLRSLAKRADPYGSHRRSSQCDCSECIDDKIRITCLRGPFLCADKAKEILSRLEGTKWHPNSLMPRHDGLSLTRRRLDENVRAERDDDYITFDPSIKSNNASSEGFRMFDTGVFSPLPARRAQRFQIRNE